MEIKPETRLIENRPLTVGAILPHAKLFGGVKRFFELRKIFTRKSHQFLIFTPDGMSPEWLSSEETLKLDEINRYAFDALFITNENFLPQLVQSNSRLKIMYHVGPRATLHQALRTKGITIFVNSTNMYELDKRKYGIEAVKALGGVHLPLQTKTEFFGKPFTVMAFGRLSRKGKGTSLVVKACESLYRKGYNVQLLLFDTPIDALSEEKIKNFTCSLPFEFVVNHPVDRNFELFQRADVFVAAEKTGGWSNTAAEALASGVPLIGTTTGTKDFLIHGQTGQIVWRHSYFIRKALEKLMRDPDLARSMAANGRMKIEGFGWSKLADFIECYIYKHT
jgi:glycosyltransferase involved in cell wall biosynthesis